MKRHVLILVFIYVGSIACAVGLAELFLRHQYGLGSPVLYDAHMLYGYRPKPNQKLSRFKGAVITLNNLGLRNRDDWDEITENKLLVVGDSVTYGGSYIDDTELFTTLLQSKLPGMFVGNAGVNAWGVENITGLIVDAKFLPAKQVITCVIENDFYRGVATGFGWRANPFSALSEVFWHFVELKLNRVKYQSGDNEPASETNSVVENAVKKLKAMDTFLQNKGIKHLIVISPSRDQLLGSKTRDKRVADLCRENGLEVIYMADFLPKENISPTVIHSWYHDGLHLSKLGHQIWASALRDLIPKTYYHR